jgi:hypothetical protein
MRWDEKSFALDGTQNQPSRSIIEATIMSQFALRVTYLVKGDLIQLNVIRTKVFAVRA